MEWLRASPKSPDVPSAEANENRIHATRSAPEQQWTLEGDSRILKVLRARGFPADEMVPMLVELQAGRLLSQTIGTRCWNPVSGEFDEPFTRPRFPSTAYDIRVARLTRWTFHVDLDNGTVAEAMTSEEVPESEVNSVPESREERFRRVVHRFTMAGHCGRTGYRVPKVVPGSPGSKVPLVLESRTTPAGGSLLLMPRATLHALFGGGPFTLCRHAVDDFLGTQQPGWTPEPPHSKKRLVLLLAVLAAATAAYILASLFLSPHSHPEIPLRPVFLQEWLPGAMAAAATLCIAWWQLRTQLQELSRNELMCLSDPLSFLADSVKECPAFQKSNHPQNAAEKPEDMRQLLSSMGVSAPLLVAAGTGTVCEHRPAHSSLVHVSNLDRYWSTILVLALWSPEFQKHLCDDSNGLFRWRSPCAGGLRYGPISGARLLHCGVLVLGRATIMPKEICTELFRCA